MNGIVLSCNSFRIIVTPMTPTISASQPIQRIVDGGE